MWINSTKCNNSDNLLNDLNANPVTTIKSILKETFNDMRKMHNLGFNTSYGGVCELVKQNNLDVDGYYTKREIKLAVAKTFKIHWHINLNF